VVSENSAEFSLVTAIGEHAANAPHPTIKNTHAQNALIINLHRDACGWITKGGEQLVKNSV